jgi:hypothetical protein
MKIDIISDYELAAKKYKLLDMCRSFPNSDIMIEMAREIEELANIITGMTREIEELVNVIETYKQKEAL